MLCKLVLFSIAILIYFTIVIAFCYKPTEIFEFCGGGIIVNETSNSEAFVYENGTSVLHNSTK